jgi:hypothetical protein
MFGFGLGYNTILPRIGSALDPDAAQFIANWEAETSTTMQLTQRMAINDFYRGMKGEGTANGSNLWALATSTNARIYPLIPLSDSSANSSAYRLDAVSNGVLKGTYTNFVSGDFTPQGVIGGTTKFFDSGVAPSAYDINSMALSVYSRTNLAINANFDFAASDSSTSNAYLLNSMNASNQFNFIIANNVSLTPPTISDSRGFNLIQNNNTSKSAVKNGIVLSTVTQALTGQTTRNLYFHSWNNNGVSSDASSRQLCFYEVGMPSLTANELLDFYTVVQRLQSNVITGGRQIGEFTPSIDSGVLPLYAIFGANYLFDWNPDVSASVSVTGSAVDSIASVGINTAAFTQTGAARPQLVANQINGKPVIRFDGATSFMAIASSTALFNFLHNSTGGTVIIVSKINLANPDAAYSFINNSGGATTEIGFNINYSDQTSLGRNNNIVSNISRGVSGALAVSNLSANDYFDTLQFNSLIAINDPANATAADRSSLIVNSGAAVKNNALTNAPSSANATQNITLGRTAVFGPFFLNGDIARIIIVDTKATPTQQAQVAARLAYEYGTFPI